MLLGHLPAIPVFHRTNLNCQAGFRTSAGGFHRRLCVGVYNHLQILAHLLCSFRFFFSTNKSGTILCVEGRVEHSIRLVA